MPTKRLLCAVTILILLVCNFGICADTPPINSVIVYYFHGNFRCVNCHNIEQYTKEAVDKYFKDDLTSHRIVFKAINIETKDNERFANEYQLYTKSVVLSLIKNGKEAKFNNLTKVWEYLGNKEVFQQYIKSEVENILRSFDR